MYKQIHEDNYKKCLKIGYLIAAILTFLGGTAIYAFFRDINNMAIFHFISKPHFIISLYNPIKNESVLSNMLIFNLPYGLWCLSGLSIIRAIWLQNTKWVIIYRFIFIVLVMFYVILKLPRLIPGTFDMLDLLFMGFFAFLESIIFNTFIRRNL